MKKLMVMALGALAFAGVQAGTVKWSYAENTDAKDPWMVYALAGTPAESFADAAAIQALSIGSGKIADWEDFGEEWFANGTAESSSLTHASAPLYFALVNADETQYALSAAYDLKDNGGTVYVAEGTETGGKTYSNIAFGEMKDFASDVPEPTSGLLLVLGVAGLALRRRRA